MHGKCAVEARIIGQTTKSCMHLVLTAATCLENGVMCYYADVFASAELLT